MHDPRLEIRSTPNKGRGLFAVTRGEEGHDGPGGVALINRRMIPDGHR
jgi:hypothetical protein